MRRATLPLAPLLLAALVIAACDGGSSATTSSAPATTTTLPPTTTAPPETTTSTTPTTTTTTIPPWSLSQYATLDSDLEFTFEIADEDDPVLPPGDGWDDSYSYSPYVVEAADGTFHLFYTGWGAETGIGHAVSTDGRHFARSSDEPILLVERDTGGRTAFAQAPIVYQADDGSWVMFFSELISRRFHGKNIWRATAPEPAGPWTIGDDPIYTAEGDWEHEVVAQSLAIADDGYLLLYDGVSGDIAIGGLWSDDGLTFTPFDDPATPEPSDPILVPSDDQSWEGLSVGSPVVFARDDGMFELFYTGFEGPENLSGDRPVRVGYAVGDLEGPWRRFADNPVFVIESQNAAASSLGYPWMSGRRIDGGFVLYYALGGGSRGAGQVTVTLTEG